MNTTSTQLRRIAIFASGKRRDLVVPSGDVLTHALAAAGVYLGDRDQVIGPEGKRIDPATPAVELREGGLYSVASVAEFADKSGLRRGDSVDSTRALQWAMAACALTATFVALVSGNSTNRWIAAVVVALAALLATIAWSLRSTDQSSLLGTASPLALGALAGTLAVSPSVEGFATFAVAAGAGVVAVLASLMGVVANSSRVRAGTSAVALVAILLASAGVASSLLGLDLAQLWMVIAGVSVVALRALPSVLVNVDEGYFIDYGKFMVLRWTARGRVPKYVPSVEESAISQIVRSAEARLQAATFLLSLMAGFGFPAAAVRLASPNLVEQIAAGAFLVLATLGLLLTSRRTAAPNLRNPPRFAVLFGAVAFTGLIAAAKQWEFAALLGGGLIVTGVLVAILSVSFARGNRSLGWSRTGDILDSLAIALVLPSALLAAGTLELLQGVLS